MGSKMKHLFWLFTLCLFFIGCSPHDVLVVANESNVQLRDVVASGSGFSERLGTIGPHETRRIAIRPRGESGLELRFKAPEKDVAFGPEGYLEGTGGYGVTATVSQDFHVTVKSELTFY